MIDCERACYNCKHFRHTGLSGICAKGKPIAREAYNYHMLMPNQCPLFEPKPHSVERSYLISKTAELGDSFYLEVRTTLLPVLFDLNSERTRYAKVANYSVPRGEENAPTLLVRFEALDRR